MASRMPDRQGFQPRGSLAERRARAERLGEDPVVQVGPPGQARVVQLGRDERSGGLGGEQEAQAPGVGGRRDRLFLGGKLGARVQGGPTLPCGQGGVVELEEHLGPRSGTGHRRRRTGGHWFERVPRAGRRLGEGRAGGQRRAPQDRVGQPQVVGAHDADAGVKEGWIPPVGVVPRPAWRRGHLLLADPGAERETPAGARRAGTRRADARQVGARQVGVGQEEVHAPSLPEATDSADVPRRWGWWLSH